MFSYEKFKSIFDKLNGEPEVTFVYSTGEKYMLIKYANYVTYTKFNSEEEVKFESLDLLYNTVLINDWDNISDIIVDEMYSVNTDMEQLIDYCNNSN